MCKSADLKVKKGLKKGKPPWLKRALPRGANYQQVTQILANAKLHTVCQAANCPNIFECFSKKTATFMILGSECTRNCRFCNITANSPQAVDPGEPMRVARAVEKLGLEYVVVTSVTRDDLPDGGAGHFAAVIKAVKAIVPSPESPARAIRVEVLIPDFQGDTRALEQVIASRPHVLNHNIETVAELYDIARPQAQYQRSLDLLKKVKSLDKSIPVKSGIMVGLGENTTQLTRTIQDLFDHGCSILTIGQYLQPTKHHLPVKKYYTPQEFELLEQTARKIGIKQVASGPFVRSSYKAGELLK